MTTRLGFALLCGSVVGLLGLSSTGVWAQEASQSVIGGLQLEEVVVQVRRTEENVQRVPLAVSVISESDLQRSDVKDLVSLTKNVPGLTLCCQPGTTPFIWIRGLQGVATYFADVPGSLTGFASFFDADSVQVLKGPQGTLFGVATNGGAIVVMPRRPDSAQDGFVSGVVGQDGRHTIEGAFNLPIVEDKVLTRFSAASGHTDGYVRDLSTNKLYGDENYWVARFSLTLKPTENLENYTMYQYSKDWGDGAVLGIATAVNPNGLARQVFGPELDAVLARQRELGVYKVEGLSAAGEDGGTRVENARINLVNITTWDITNNLTLKNIFGYQSASSYALNDTDGSILPISDGSALTERPRKSPTYSEELQLRATPFDNLELTTGVFFSKSRGATNRGTYLENEPFISYSVGMGTLGAQKTSTKSETRALYAQGTYDLSGLVDGLSVTAGYRYTWDELGSKNWRYTIPTLEVNRYLEDEAEWQNGSWTAGLQYQATASTMFFFSASKGYSRGGMALAAPPELRVWGPETLTNLEVGTKSTFSLGDVQIRSNVSVFYGYYDDAQVLSTLPVQVNPPPAPPSFQTVTANAATARIKGVDAEITVRLLRSLQFNGTIGYTDHEFTEYESYNNQGEKIDLSSSPFGFAPKMKYTLGLTYDLPFPALLGTLSFSGTYYHRDKYYNIVKPVALMGEGDVKPGHENVDVSLNWRDVMGKAGLDATVFVTNLTENEITDSQLSGYSAIGYYAATPAVPRRAGLRVTYKF